MYGAVIGSGTSAHDIGAEMWEAGADVTMIQRSPTIVMRHESVIAPFASLYGDEARARGVTPEMADLLFASVPLRVLLQTQQQLVADIKEAAMSADLVHMANISYRTGRKLHFDPRTERFVNDEEANSYITRKYREPFVVPEKV